MLMYGVVLINVLTASKSQWLSTVRLSLFLTQEKSLQVAQPFPNLQSGHWTTGSSGHPSEERRMAKVTGFHLPQPRSYAHHSAPSPLTAAPLQQRPGMWQSLQRTWRALSLPWAFTHLTLSPTRPWTLPSRKPLFNFSFPRPRQQSWENKMLIGQGRREQQRKIGTTVIERQ